MNILDRYIARQYVINILVLLFLLFTFVVVIDVSLNLQRFVNIAERYLKDSGQESGGLRRALVTALFVADLWWPRLLQLFNYVLGLVLIGAMGFTFAQLVRHRELVAVMASGISLYRVARPIMLVAGCALMVQVVNQELVIPQIAPLVSRNNDEIAVRDIRGFRVTLVRDGQGRLFFAQEFDPKRSTLRGLNVWERDSSGRAMRRIDADQAVYSGGQWTLERGLMRPMAVGDRAGAASDPLALQPRPVKSIQSDLDPTSLLTEQYRIYAHLLSSTDLFSYALSANVKPEVREQLLRVAWGRVALLVCSMLSLVVSIPFFLTREPKNMVLQSLKCAPVAIGSLLGSVLGTAAPIPGLPVEFAVWLPVLALLPTAIAMGTSVKT